MDTNIILKAAFGGGCHWCTEAVFQALKGVVKVEQGFVAPLNDITNFSEAVIVSYNPADILLKDLIQIHLYTHNSTKNHSFRHKYRSAVYVFSKGDKKYSEEAIASFQHDFEEQIITQVLDFGAFKISDAQFQNYYSKNPEKPFCKTHIAPKLGLLMQRFSKHL